MTVCDTTILKQLNNVTIAEIESENGSKGFYADHLLKIEFLKMNHAHNLSFLVTKDIKLKSMEKLCTMSKLFLGD
ncbi:hypothetical protein XA20_11105 [Lacticaseibacillus rhamnosus]|jgi:hypothetical protein|nr:hypothetical protein LCACRF28_2644 [Lacticaseibacillus paracasei]KKW87127.1 hypothetical protein XA20_11105 [Lacticaseibacillus rhamnosus]